MYLLVAEPGSETSLLIKPVALTGAVRSHRRTSESMIRNGVLDSAYTKNENWGPTFTTRLGTWGQNNYFAFKNFKNSTFSQFLDLFHFSPLQINGMRYTFLQMPKKMFFKILKFSLYEKKMCSSICWWMLTMLIVIILQYIKILSHYIVHLKLWQFYMSIIPQFKKKEKERVFWKWLQSMLLTAILKGILNYCFLCSLVAQQVKDPAWLL